MADDICAVALVHERGDLVAGVDPCLRTIWSVRRVPLCLDVAQDRDEAIDVIRPSLAHRHDGIIGDAP